MYMIESVLFTSII